VTTRVSRGLEGVTYGHATPASGVKILHRSPLLVLVLALTTCVVGITWGLPSPASEETLAPWELDAVAPIMPLTEAYYLFTRAGSDWLTYPLFHFIVLSLAYAPYMGVQYLTGGLVNPAATYPYGMTDIVAMTQALTLIARGVSLVMALGTVWLVWRTAQCLFNTTAATWAAVLIALLAPFTYYAKTSNLDVPYLFWTWGALYAYVRALQTNRLTYYAALGVTTALAVATKDQAYGFFVLPPLAVIYGVARHKSGARVTAGALLQALVSREIVTAALATVVTFALANNLLFGWPGFRRHVDYILTGGSQLWRMFPTTLWGEWMLARLSSRLLLESLGWGSLLLAAGGIVWTAVRGRYLALSVLLFPASYCAFFLGVVGYAYPRFLIGPAMVLLLFAGAAIERLTQVRGALRPLAWLLIVVSVGYQSLLTANLTLTLVADSRVAAENWIRQHVPRGATIESPIVREALLPHLSREYKVTLHGHGDRTPNVDELTPAALKARAPDYLLLVSLGMSSDHDSWQDPRLVGYRDALMSARLGYHVVATFDTPHFVPFRQLTGTRPDVVVLARDGVEPTHEGGARE
jgi:Dolichyl-phosphate-mannose-protein mannosyltransferase